jgi:hypothetical protein
MCAALFGAGGAVAQPYFLNQGVQEFEDNDYEALFRYDNGVLTAPAIDSSSFIQVGDIFAGVLKIQATQVAETTTSPAGPTTDLQNTNTFTAIFAIETTSVSCIGAGCSVAVRDNFTDVLAFKPASQTTWNEVFGPGGLADVSSEVDVSSLADGTAIMWFDNVDYVSADEGLANLSLSATSFVKDGILQYEFGFTGGGDTPGPDEFWSTRGEDAALPFFTGATTPSNRIALNITQRWAGPALEPHNWRLDVRGDSLFTGPTEFQGFGSVTGISGVGTPWPVVTDTDAYMSSIPEPASIALMSLGLVGLGFASRKK